MPLVTASSWGRAVKCKASLHLPRLPQPQTPEAKRGGELHLAVEDALRFALTIGLRASVGVARQHLPPECANWPLEAVIEAVLKTHRYRPGVSLECPYAMHMPTMRARKLERGEPREYRGSDDEDVAGTADQASGFEKKQRLIVSDLKTGDFPVEPDSQQMRLLSTMIARTHRKRRADSVIIQCPATATQTSEVEVKKVTLGHRDFELTERDIWKVWRSSALSPTVPGDWCRFCPAAQGCDENMSALNRPLPQARPRRWKKRQEKT